MTGQVDQQGRALIPLSLQSPASSVKVSCDAWVDTGFTGDLLLTDAEVQALGLQPVGDVSARLADGTRVTLTRYLCRVHWSGVLVPATALLGAGPLPLVGIGLLAGFVLMVDYRKGTVSVS